MEGDVGGLRPKRRWRAPSVRARRRNVRCVFRSDRPEPIGPLVRLQRLLWPPKRLPPAALRPSVRLQRPLCIKIGDTQLLS
ncbi:hypothetical protein ALCH109712_07345 [Alkalicoccus chagannorensis]